MAMRATANAAADETTSARRLRERTVVGVMREKCDAPRTRVRAQTDLLHDAHREETRSSDQTARAHLVDRDSEPRRVAVRSIADVAQNLGDIDPLDGRNLSGMGCGLRVASTDEHVVELVLDERWPNVGAIDEAERELQWAIEAKLLDETTMCGVRDRFVWRGMAAARVRPEAARVVLVEGALLQEHLAPGRIEDEDRDGPMEHAVDVRALLFANTNLAVVFIDEDDVGHISM